MDTPHALGKEHPLASKPFAITVVEFPGVTTQVDLHSKSESRLIPVFLWWVFGDEQSPGAGARQTTSPPAPAHSHSSNKKYFQTKSFARVKSRRGELTDKSGRTPQQVAESHKETAERLGYKLDAILLHSALGSI